MCIRDSIIKCRFIQPKNVDNYFLSTECVKNFPVDEMEDSLWITGNLMLIKLWIEGWKNRNV